MGLEIENAGSGTIGDLGAGWNISLNSSPAILGDGAGRFGTLSFSATCDNTTKFTIDNYLTVKHFYDDQVTRWLTAFDVRVQSVSPGLDVANFSAVSALAALDVDRTTSVDVSGLYEGTIELPITEYTIPGNGTFTTGGFWTSVGSENVFVPRPTIIWDVSVSEHFVYVLADGGHNGQVVFQLQHDGMFRALWPVYSDATDLAGPDSRFLSVGTGAYFVGQSGAKRIKRFNLDGTFHSQWGSLGTGDGQFQTISGLAADPDFNSVFATDSVLGRITRFNYSGTYQNKWGSAGTGTGNSVFNGVNYISSEPGTSYVLVSDLNARVRLYDSFGNFQAQPMGSYDFVKNISTGEFTSGRTIKTGFDHIGNAYAIQDGWVHKYKKGVPTWTVSTGKPVKSWFAGSESEPAQPNVFGISHISGMMHVGWPEDSVMRYAASTGTIAAYLMYMIGLAAPDFPVRFASLAPNSYDIAYPGAAGNIWVRICELMAVSGNTCVAFDDKIFFMNRSTSAMNLNKFPHEVIPLDLNSRARGRSVKIVNYNARYTSGYELLYTAAKDNGRVFNVDVNSYTVVNVRQDTYPEYIYKPKPSTLNPPANGEYNVIDDNGVLVPAADWTKYGGAVTAAISDTPGEITLAIYGPGMDVPGYPGPYKIASVAGQAAFSLLGTGVITEPETISIGTGVPESVSNREVAMSLDSPFVMNAQIAYTEGSWAAYNAGTPTQRIQIRYPTRHSYVYGTAEAGSAPVLKGLAQTVNLLVIYDEAEYIVDTVDYTADYVTLGCYRYTKIGHELGGEVDGPRPQEIWAGVPAGNFDAYWAKNTAQDFTIAPLRNPFGV